MTCLKAVAQGRVYFCWGPGQNVHWDTLKYTKMIVLRVDIISEGQRLLPITDLRPLIQDFCNFFCHIVPEKWDFRLENIQK